MNSPNQLDTADNDHDVLTDLSLIELDILRALKAEYDAATAGTSDWLRFKQFWWDQVLGHYDRVGLPRKKTVETVLYKYGRVLATRLTEAAGVTRPSENRGRKEF